MAVVDGMMGDKFKRLTDKGAHATLDVHREEDRGNGAASAAGGAWQARYCRAPPQRR
ncbi:hypothetical protein Cni_G23220 [Canna indica]|uniref:Uncharacterized protein n=1 Tax=Canna indica TaxID=4628 RepID=A0AAQ3KTK3_9LILI|nr:hypothetical protein Cni_G23220 [Canna indica]